MSYATCDIRNVALAGHPGAGKTTLCEALLHAGGALTTAGTVERGTTVSDFDPMEKARGHSMDIAIASIDPTDLHGRFRWWGLYTQRKPGIDGGRTATLSPEELEDEEEIEDLDLDDLED